MHDMDSNKAQDVLYGSGTSDNIPFLANDKSIRPTVTPRDIKRLDVRNR